jgi:enterochelin esterase-like enzyme
MRHPLPLLVTLILLVSTTFSAGATSTVTIFSPSNNRNLSFVVYTPPGYSASTQRYPVVYSLHGIGGTASGRASQVAPTVDAAIVAGTAMPMIWVFPDGQTNAFWGDAFDGHKQVYSHVIGEILPYVDANYRTVADRDHRALEGFSMGGFGAAMYAAKHPELFSAIIESGGALSTWNNLTTFNHAVAVEMYNDVEANWLPYSLWDLTASNATALRNTVDYKMIVGDEDPQMGSNVTFRNFLQGLNIDPQFQVLPGVEHLGGQYFQEGSALAFLVDHFNTVPEPGAAVTLLAAGALVLNARRYNGRRAI